MCLAVPARILERAGDEAVVDLHGNRLRVSLLLLPDVQQDDWVLVHAGFAIQRLDREAAERTWSVLREATVVTGEQP